MYLTVGGLVIPPVTHEFVRSAFAFMEGLEGPAIAGWWPTSAEVQPYWWYAGIKLFRRSDSTDAGVIGNVAEGIAMTESHVVVNGETAAALDAIFAANVAPALTLADGTTTISLGQVQLHTRTLVKAAPDPAESVWVYELCFYSPDSYRTGRTVRHAGPWLDVMLADTYPREGSPITAGPTLFDRAAETVYIYASNIPAVAGPMYGGSFDVQFDSGCRYSISLVKSSNRGEAGYEIEPPRFWTLAETLKAWNAEWETYSDRIIFGGRMDADQLAGIYPTRFTAEYQLPGVPPSPPPPPSDYTFSTGARLASGAETFDLGLVKSDAAIAAQVERLAEWEAHARRHFVTVFLGLVPWRLTPLDTSIEWRLPIDGVQQPVTILYGVEGRTDLPPTPTVANPAPPGGQITVTFTRPASPTAGHDTPPAGQLTRDGYGSSPPFVPPAMVGTTASYVYDSLADGTYTVAPGAPWSPTTQTVVVANGSTHTMTFNR